MKIVRPVTIDDMTLVSSSAVETVALYDAGTSYSVGQLARRDTTHRIYESLQGSNTGNTPESSPEWWVDIGPANIWSMFDELNSTQTEAVDQIIVVLAPGERIDVIALLNVYAVSAHVVATDAIDGVVFDETVNLVSTGGIIDWYTYYTEPQELAGDVVFDGLPALYANLTFTVTLSFPGQTVRCGALIAGLAKDIGATVYGATTGIIDFSRKATDDFGNTSVTRRGYANKGNFRVVCDNVSIVSIQRLLAEFRATPSLFIGSAAFANTFIYGFYRDFSIAIDHPNQSHLNIELEGLL